MHINQLDDYSLCLVFDQLPLADFVRLKLVCDRWQVLQQDLCLRKRHLSLVSITAYHQKRCNLFGFIINEPRHHQLKVW